MLLNFPRYYVCRSVSHLIFLFSPVSGNRPFSFLLHLSHGWGDLFLERDGKGCITHTLSILVLSKKLIPQFERDILYLFCLGSHVRDGKPLRLRVYSYAEVDRGGKDVKLVQIIVLDWLSKDSPSPTPHTARPSLKFLWIGSPVASYITCSELGFFLTLFYLTAYLHLISTFLEVSLNLLSIILSSFYTLFSAFPSVLEFYFLLFYLIILI